MRWNGILPDKSGEIGKGEREGGGGADGVRRVGRRGDGILPGESGEWGQGERERVEVGWERGGAEGRYGEEREIGEGKEEKEMKMEKRVKRREGVWDVRIGVTGAKHRAVETQSKGDAGRKSGSFSERRKWTPSGRSAVRRFTCNRLDSVRQDVSEADGADRQGPDDPVHPDHGGRHAAGQRSLPERV